MKCQSGRQARFDEIFLQNRLSRNRPAYALRFTDFHAAEILTPRKVNNCILIAAQYITVGG